jgi:hypothetical protein
MPNDYYNAPPANVPLTTIRSSDENGDRAAVESAFDKLPSANDIIRSQFGTDVSTVATLYKVTISQLPSGYFTGLEVSFEAQFTSTGVSSMQVNGSTIVQLVDSGGSQLVAGSVTAGQIVVAVYTSAGRFQLIQSDSASSAAQASASAAAAAVSEANAAVSEANAVAAAALFNSVNEHFHRNRNV